MGSSDFGQVRRLISKRFSERHQPAERWKAQIESCR